jgi:prepilin-type N-terminal cleavage/methylation domain-containing protein
MSSTGIHSRRGLTLVELLVVITIIGLLGVTVTPLLVGNRDQKSIRNAADVAESLFSHVATKAMTTPTGAAAWLETDAAGAGNDSSVSRITFARVPAAAYGTTTIALDSVSPETNATVSLSLTPSLADDLPSPIEFAGIPGVFTATGTSKITSLDTAVSGAMNRTKWNATAPPATSVAVPYILHLPPRPSSLASATALPEGVAIDLSASQIGLSTTGTSGLSGIRRFAIEYGRTGSPTAAWTSQSQSGGGWSRQVLTSSTPIVLALGMRSQAGASWVEKPTEEDPGASWQAPYARWLLIDPRNGRARIIEAGSTTGAANASEAFSRALTPVVEDYTNARTGG